MPFRDAIGSAAALKGDKRPICNIEERLTVMESLRCVDYLVTDPDVLRRMEVPICGVFGNRDQGIPPPVVDAFAGALETADREFELHRFDAEHAFANPSSARYDPEASAEAWIQVRRFLTRHLKETE